MKSNYKKLGDYIQLVDERNRDNFVTRLLGVSIEKKFIESIANTIGTDMSVYKIVKQGQFAYGPVTSRNGDKVSIALLEEEKCIISSSYTVFEIKDTQQLLPEYLMLWFRRPEFDRYARFHSHGSAREIFDWEEMCNVELPVPEIEEQQKIVDSYRAIENRISILRQINDNLAESIDLIFREKIIMSEFDLTNLTDFLTFERGVEPGSDAYKVEKSNYDIPFFRVQDILNISSDIYIEKSIAKNKICKPNEIVVSFDGSVGKIGFGFYGAFSSGMQKISSKFPGFSSALIFAMFRSNEIQIELNKTEGTTIAHAGKFIKDLRLPFNLELYSTVQKLIAPIFDKIYYNKIEIDKLEHLKKYILSQLSN